MNPILPIEYIILTSGIVFIACGYATWKSTAKCRLKLRLPVLFCRMAAIVLLLLIALNPGEWQNTKKTAVEKWCILLDQSRSMNVKDEEDEKTRWRKAMETAQDIHKQSGDNREIDMYLFSDMVNSIAKPSSVLSGATVIPDGPSTEIYGAIESILSTYASSENLKGIFLLSDGRQIPVEENLKPARRALARNIPIYSVCYGGEVEQKDLVLKSARSNQIAFSGQTVKLKATLTNSHVGNIIASVQLRDSDGQTLDEKKVRVNNNETAEVLFDINPDQPGYHEYFFRTPLRKEERIAGNNEASTGITMLEEKIKVLAVEGSPHWDSKFLMQFLGRQPYIDLTTIIKVSTERFFRIQTDQAGPVDHKKSVFPDTLSELAQYDLVLFGKGSEYFLTPSRIQLLKAYLREYGGNVVFGRSKPYHGEYPDLSPLESVEWGQPAERKVRWQPTPEGEESGLLGHMLPPVDSPIWGKLPVVPQIHSCTSVKTFSQILIKGVSDPAISGGIGGATGIPVLISRRYGRGLVVTLNSEGLWKWGFFPDASQSNGLYEQFWIHLIQWTASHGDYLPGRSFSLRLSKRFADIDEPVKIIIRERGGKTSRKAPVLNIIREGEYRQTIHPHIAGNKGQWETTFTLSRPGKYNVKMTSHRDGKEQHLNQMLFIRPPAEEKDNLSADPKTLVLISKLSGGRSLTPDACNKILEADPQDYLTDKNAGDKWVSSWDNGILLVVVLLFFGAEWHMRRRNGLL